MNLERVFEGVKAFLDKDFYNNMNDMQKAAAKFFVLRVKRAIKNRRFDDMITPNSFLGRLLIADNDGNIDVEGIFEDAREVFREMGKIRVTIPYLDTFTFTESDIENLYRCIMGG
jgi:hypothetical protein